MENSPQKTVHSQSSKTIFLSVVHIPAKTEMAVPTELLVLIGDKLKNQADQIFPLVQIGGSTDLSKHIFSHWFKWGGGLKTDN